MAIHDSQLINRVLEEWEIIIRAADSTSHVIKEKIYTIKEVSDSISHSLDASILVKLVEISKNIEVNDSPDAIYNNTSLVMELWKMVIEKSIMCLRFYDTREPFMEYTEKSPFAYGISELKGYFEKFTEFESLLYGGSKYYRDHVIHAFRTWLLGLSVLFKNKGAYLNEMNIGDKINVNILEKVSIWSLIALTHDLGYPLEKAQGIIDSTKSMMIILLQIPHFL